MPVVRTPEERFEVVKGFPYAPQFLTIDDLRVHYVDVGEGEVILCLHGEPTWSYLYRKMIPSLSENHRVLAIDFIGFGRSDKLTEMSEYSFKLFFSKTDEFFPCYSRSIFLALPFFK